MPLEIGNTIKKLRKESGMSQAGLAERLGVTNQAVSKWESGLSLPDITLVPALAEVFGVTMDALLGGSNDGASAEALEIHTDGYVEISLEKRMDIFRRGLEKMPHNGQLLADAINTGFQLAKLYLDRGDPMADEYFSRTVSLCDRQLLRSHEPSEINYARFILAALYTMFGKNEKAGEVVSRFPSFGAAISSGAVEAEIKHMSGNVAGEIQARIDNLSQILMYISNEVYALSSACKKLLEINESEGGQMAGEREQKYVWAAEFQKPGLIRGSNFEILAFSGNFMYYTVSEDARSYLYRYELRSGESEKVDIPNTGNMLILGLSCVPDGPLYVILVKNAKEDSDFYCVIIKIDTEGKAELMTEVSGEFSDRMLSGMPPFAVDSEENVYLSFSDGVEVFRRNGERLCSLGYEDFRGIVRLTDGRVAAVVFNIKPALDPAEFFAVKPVDPKKRAWDEPVFIGPMKALPRSGRGKYMFFCIDQNDDFVGYDSENREFETLFSCTELNINIGQVLAIDAPKEGIFRIATVSFATVINGGAALELAGVTKKLRVRDERITLEYAAYSLNQTARQMIAEFNRTNEKYQIHVTQYMVKNEKGIVDSALTAKQIADVMSSNSPPDIADLLFAPIGFLAHRGLLEDLYPYIDSDNELSRADFFPSLLKAFEVGGKLCYLAPKVAVSTLLGLPAFIGEDFEMKPDDLDALMEKYPGTSIAHGWTNIDTLRNLLEHSYPDFVNMKTGQCCFSDGGFVKLLKIANRHPSHTDGKSLYQAAWDGDILMENAEILSFLQLQYYRDIFGDDPVFKAYPDRSGNGNLLSVHQLYAISSKSRHKDAAWQFVRMLITSDIAGGFPLLKSKLDDMIRREMTANYVDTVDVPWQAEPDEKGTKGFKLSKDGRIIRYNMGQRRMKEEVTDKNDIYKDMVWIYEASAEDCSKTLELLEASGRVSVGPFDRELSDIVVGGAEPYFRGEITAEEAAELIQIKAAEYLRRLFENY